MKMQKNYCFVCGKDNPDGMNLRFTYDEERNSSSAAFGWASATPARPDTATAASSPPFSMKPWAR